MKVAAALIALAALCALPWLVGPLGLRMAIEMLYLGLFAMAYNLLFGWAGMLSFGFSAPFGVAGYAFALAEARWPGLSFPLAFAFAILAGAVVNALVGALCVRLQGGYFSLLTLAFSQFFFAIALKWRDVTKGEDGLMVAPPALPHFGASAASLGADTAMYAFSLTCVALSIALMRHLIATPLGAAVALNRENSERAQFLGYNVYALRLFAFAAAGGFAALAGVLYAMFQKLVSPATFSLDLGGEALFMTVMGGSQAFLGPLVGAVTYVALQDWLSRATEHWPFVVGLMFIALVIFAPEGLTGLAEGLVSSRPRSQREAAR